MTDLRDYQAAAVEQIARAGKALYVLPTGGGKTIVATSIIERAVERGERVLMLTHRRVASAQARLVANQIDTIGASLRQKAITCKGALEWAHEEGVMHWIKFGLEGKR